MMNKRILIITMTCCWLCATGSVFASGGGEDVSSEHALDDAPYRAPTSVQDSLESWLNHAEQRMAEIEALKHEREVARMQVEIGVERQRCREIGYDCPLMDRQAPIIADEGYQELPVLTSIVGNKACFGQGGRCQWRQVGETYQGLTISAVHLDHIVVQGEDEVPFKIMLEYAR